MENYPQLVSWAFDESNGPVGRAPRGPGRCGAKRALNLEVGLAKLRKSVY